jgi:hypothetical protein
MKSEDETPDMRLDHRPAGFHDFVRELEAMGELDLDDDIGAPSSPGLAMAGLRGSA